MILKNIAGQGVYLFAVDASGNPKTGDSANITATLAKAAGTPAATGTTHPTEVGGGVYWLPLAQAETNAAALVVLPVSSTGGVILDPVVAYPTTADANGLPSVNLVDVGGVSATMVSGAVDANLTAIQGQSVAAGAPVTFPASVGTSTYAGGAVASVTAGVTVATNNDKSGYVLHAAGLDQISTADPGAPAGHNTFAKLIVAAYRALWKKNTMTANQWKRYADDGSTINATSPLTDDGTTQTYGHFA